MSHTQQGSRQRLWSGPAPIRNARVGEEQLEIRAEGPGSSFQQFMQSPESDIVAFFRTLCTELQELGQHDYHMKLQNRFDHQRYKPLPGWDIVAFYDADDKAPRDGPLKVERCMSCDLDCPLAIGVLGTTEQHPDGPVSRDSLLHETEHMRAWFDAKARPMVVVTPKKHIESLGDLSDAEMLDLFATALQMLERLGCRNFQTMIMNHGTSRSHAHLHLKVRIPYKDFSRAQHSWPPDWKGALQKMQQFAETLPDDRNGTYQAFALRRARQQQQYQQHQQPPQQQHWQQQKYPQQHQQQQHWRHQQHHKMAVPPPPPAAKPHPPPPAAARKD